MEYIKITLVSLIVSAMVLTGANVLGLVGSSNQPNQDLGASGTRFPNGVNIGTTTPVTSSNIIRFGADDATTTILTSKFCLGMRWGSNSEQYIYYYPATTTTLQDGKVYGGWATSTKSCS